MDLEEKEFFKKRIFSDGKNGRIARPGWRTGDYHEGELSAEGAGSGLPSCGGGGGSRPKYPIPPGNSLTMLKFLVTWGDLTVRFGMTTLKSWAGYQ